MGVADHPLHLKWTRTTVANGTSSARQSPFSPSREGIRGTDFHTAKEGIPRAGFEITHQTALKLTEGMQKWKHFICWVFFNSYGIV